MIHVDALKKILDQQGFSVVDLAKWVDLPVKTLHCKLKSGVLGTDEIQIMVRRLGITDPAAIFFADEVTYEDTEYAAQRVSIGEST